MVSMCDGGFLFLIGSEVNVLPHYAESVSTLDPAREVYAGLYVDTREIVITWD